MYFHYHNLVQKYNLQIGHCKNMDSTQKKKQTKFQFEIIAPFHVELIKNKQGLISQVFVRIIKALIPKLPGYNASFSRHNKLQILGSCLMSLHNLVLQIKEQYTITSYKKEQSMVSPIFKLQQQLHQTSPCQRLLSLLTVSGKKIYVQNFGKVHSLMIIIQKELNKNIYFLF